MASWEAVSRPLEISAPSDLGDHDRRSRLACSDLVEQCCAEVCMVCMGVMASCWLSTQSFDPIKLAHATNFAQYLTWYRLPSMHRLDITY